MKHYSREERWEKRRQALAKHDKNIIELQDKAYFAWKGLIQDNKFSFILLNDFVEAVLKNNKII